MDESWSSRYTEAQKRKITAQTFYEFEIEARRQGWGDPAFIYDEEKDLFRWTDSKFAFSREHADWELLKKSGRMKGFEAPW
jgi:hypothetical protein